MWLLLLLFSTKIISVRHPSLVHNLSLSLPESQFSIYCTHMAPAVLTVGSSQFKIQQSFFPKLEQISFYFKMEMFPSSHALQKLEISRGWPHSSADCQGSIPLVLCQPREMQLRLSMVVACTPVIPLLKRLKTGGSLLSPTCIVKPYRPCTKYILETSVRQRKLKMTSQYYPAIFCILLYFEST